MKLLVTNAKTIQGVYYGKGSVAEFGDTTGGSYHRLYGWPYADEDGEVSAAPVYSLDSELGPPPVFADLTKPKLKAYAREHDIELPAKATRDDILEILEA